MGRLEGPPTPKALGSAIDLHGGLAPGPKPATLGSGPAKPWRASIAYRSPGLVVNPV